MRPRTATALLLDLSWSMPLQGHLVPAKRMALALHALITGSHRQDSLHLVGFSDYARRMQPADLSATGFDRVYGTNMHHAFLLARRILMDDPRPIKQVIMVTDGEPTAHLVGGQAWFNWPPDPRDAGGDAARGQATGTVQHLAGRVPARGQSRPGGVLGAAGRDHRWVGHPVARRGARPPHRHRLRPASPGLVERGLASSRPTSGRAVS